MFMISIMDMFRDPDFSKLLVFWTCSPDNNLHKNAIQPFL